MDFAEAIESRRVLAFDYDGHPRVVVPAAFGLHATTGNQVLRGYQTGGTSKSRSVPFWSLFLIDKIVAPEFTGETFSVNPPDYTQGDVQISPIIREL